MKNESIKDEKILRETRVTNEFLDEPSEHSFEALFHVFFPQLIAFFRAHTREHSSAEDLAQEVMLLVYRNAKQVRDRKVFRDWLFKIAHHALYRHYGRSRRVQTLSLSGIDNALAGNNQQPGRPAFEFQGWLRFLDPKERDVMTLRYVEDWEYHEIAAARGTPIGTIQWRVSNCKKKLAKHLMHRGRQRDGITGSPGGAQRANIGPVITGAC